MGRGASCASPSACAAVHGGAPPNSHQSQNTTNSKPNANSSFQMPLHYPRYKKSDYETMPEWQLDLLLGEYGLPAAGDLHEKRRFAMGAFLWPDQFQD